MPAYPAWKRETTTGQLIACALEDLVAEHFDALAAAIRGFAEAVAWPDIDATEARRR